MSSYGIQEHAAIPQLEPKKITVPWIKQQKQSGNKIVALTAYDFAMASLLDQAGVDLLLVGDSVATVVYGEPNTLSVTMEDMLRHTKAVSKAAKRALVVADMPFLSYQTSLSQAVENAGRFLKESSAQAVKLEGGLEMAETVAKITRAGIPVMAHIGLTPQSIHSMGSYRMHGKTQEEIKLLADSAKALEQAGAFCVVLECVQKDLSLKITQELQIPTIGIGSGDHCDGQVLVSHDLVGLTFGKTPKFVKPLASLNPQITEAAKQYIARTKGSVEQTMDPHDSKSLEKTALEENNVPCH